MENSPIYTSEPMVTRALAAEIRHDHRRFLQLLLHRSNAEDFGTLRSVQCEAVEQIDVQLEFDSGSTEPYRVGIEAKFDHELSRDQVERETAALDRLFVLVAHSDSVPGWLAADFPEVQVITWDETLACFFDSRITLLDIASIKLLKATVEARLGSLRVEDRLVGWDVRTAHGGSGMPSIVIESPQLPDGRTLRGQIEAAGRGMPESVDAVRFVSHIGIAVPESPESYFDPALSDTVPGWIGPLRTLQREVLQGEEDRLLVSRRAPGTSTRELGRWKIPLARKHLGEHAYLAKGYTDGWAIGPKTQAVPFEDLDALAAITVEIFQRWYEAETR